MTENGNGMGKDLFRDTPVRYLGYANEVGEAFRSQVHVNAVRFSYLVASGYVVADSVNKGQVAAQQSHDSPEQKHRRIKLAVLDTLIWQGLASVAIPGFTINRICALSGVVLKRSTAWPGPVRKWTTTLIGLGCIPFIIKPIDRSVDWFMESTFRHWWKEGPVVKSIIRHERKD